MYVKKTQHRSDDLFHSKSSQSNELIKLEGEYICINRIFCLILRRSGEEENKGLKNNNVGRPRPLETFIIIFTV